MSIVWHIIKFLSFSCLSEGIHQNRQTEREKKKQQKTAKSFYIDTNPGQNKNQVPTIWFLCL